MEHLAIELGIILLLGFAAQWLAWRLAIPSILLLLTFGFLAGPVFNIIHPDELFGGLISPLVSVAVGIILFEGGLTLKLIELRHVGRVVRNLNTIGVMVTLVMATVAAFYLLDLSWPLALQLGAILTVTGPTVIGPLLRHVGNVGAPGTILKWEGILIDPVGATIALLVYEGIRVSSPDVVLSSQVGGALVGFVTTALVGGVVGAIGAAIVVFSLRHLWVPDFLQNPFTLTMVVAAFAVANTLQHESGLLATTVMGIALANAREVDAQHILEFKENLVLLFISMLFIVLSARLDLAVLSELNVGIILFLLVLVLIVRPVGVWLSSLGSSLTTRERLFVAWLAPRGIVAAAVASLFGEGLAEAGFEGGERLEPLVFLVIVGTVLVYGLTAVPVSRWLGVVQTRSGVVIAGAQRWARQIAVALQDAGQEVLLVDNNASHIRAAEREGLPAIQGNILSEFTEDKAELANLGRLLALTPNDEVNALAVIHFADRIGKDEVYQLVPEGTRTEEESLVVPPTLRGQPLFSEALSARAMTRAFDRGATLLTTTFTAESTYADFEATHGERATPLFLIGAKGDLTVATAGRPLAPQPGQTLITLLAPA